MKVLAMNYSICMLLLNTAQQQNETSSMTNETISSETLQTSDNILSNATYAVISALMFFLTLAGVLENGAVIYVFLVREKLRNSTNSLVAFLSVCNFLIAALAVPFVAASALAKKWLFGQMGCEFHGFVVTGLGLTQICVLAVISIDRYIMIVKRYWIKKITFTCYIGLIVGCVLYGFLCATFPLLGWNSYTLEVAKLSCSIDWEKRTLQSKSYCVFLLIMGLFIPLSLIVGTYVNIVRKIKHQRINSFVNSREDTKKKSLRRESKVASTILILIGAFLLSWLPYSIYSVISLAGGTDNVPALVATIPSFTAKFSILWNPIIYTYRNRKFRKALIETFPVLFTCSKCCLKHRQRSLHEEVLAEERNSLCDSSQQTESRHTQTKETEFVMLQTTDIHKCIVTTNIDTFQDHL